MQSMRKFSKNYQRIVTSLVGLILLHCSVNSGADEKRESKLKAAYIVNLVSFVTWPNVKDTIDVCVAELSPVASSMSEQDGSKLNNGRILRIINKWENFEDCDVLYWDFATVDLANIHSLYEVSNRLLTISDKKGALDDGFAMQFYTRNFKLRFAINDDVMKNADYRVSSKLMRLARQVN